MDMRSVESNKAKIAHRVIEVLDFFDDAHPEATVMDIARRYNRPQSSTSELLSSLVNLGMLFKDPTTRSYSPTPRAALLGATTQPDLVRDGRLVGAVDRLIAQTGLGVAIFGMVGLNAQIYSWRQGTTGMVRRIAGGMQERMADAAVGWLLLSTVPQPRRDGVIRRLNAEASDDRKFCFSEMVTKVQTAQDAGFSSGPSGFGANAECCAMLLPGQPANRPLAVGFVYEPSAQIDPAALRVLLAGAVERCSDQPEASATVLPIFNVA
jgi:DNA-binding IclR family transcriptional regulator